MLELARRAQALRRPAGPPRHRPGGAEGLGRLRDRAERIRQEHPAPLRQPARAAGRGDRSCWRARRSPEARGTASTSSGGGSAWCSSSSTCSRTCRRSRTSASRRRRCWSGSRERGRREGARAARAGRALGQGVRVPGAPVRRAAAARRDRPGARDGPARDAVRRGHERARPRADQGGARRDAGAGRRGNDDDRRDARDGLRPRRRRTRSSSWTRA